MRDRIDFDPPYQRESGIWPTKNKSFLIDTIINSYDIPKFYVVDFSLGKSTLNKKNMMYAIIDGKQRFQAIIEFYSDKLMIGEKHDFKYEKNPCLDLNGMKFSQLQIKHPNIARDFDNFHIDVISVWADSEDPIRSLFVRLNTQVSVNGAEKRNALRGIVMDQTRSLALHNFFTRRISFDIKRMADKNAAVKLLWLEFKSSLVDTKKRGLDDFAKDALNAAFDKEKCKNAADRVRNILDRMEEIFLDKDPLLSSPGVIPLYYWFIKNVDWKRDNKVRLFLEAFEKQRKKNLQKSKAGEPNVNKELLGFSEARRSHNDANAMQRMYEILLKRFKEG